MSSEKKRKTADLLTICIKAGKTVKGFDSSMDAVKEGKAFCVLTASDASPKTVKEVDFVCERGDSRMYVQVAYVMESEATREREFSALMAVPDQYPKFVLTLDRVDFSAGGIVHRRIPDFLLDRSW